jgi:hypothetical protein
MTFYFAPFTISLIRLLFVMAEAVKTPLINAPPIPTVTISCPVRNKFFIGVCGFKNSLVKRYGG